MAEPKIRIRPFIGLLGVLVATMGVTFNDQVVAIAIADVRGGLGIGFDDGSWLPTLYVTGEVMGMAVAPELSVAFSVRRFALVAFALAVVSSVLVPFSVSREMLFVLRFLQGISAGLTIPLLMMTALRVLKPKIRLFGLAVYALSATFAPQFSTTLAALWTDGVYDWRFMFFQALPFGTLAAVLVWFGMDQDKPKYEMLTKFDWPGAALVALGFGSLAIVLEQGERLDWYNSQVIGVLTLVAAIAIPALIWRELTAPQPLFRLTLLKRRNFAYAGIALIMFLVIAQSASGVPLTLLQTVAGYRPIQAQVLTLIVACTQLVFLPLTALLLDIRKIDSRWVSTVGLGCIIGSCVANAYASSDWSRSQFILAQVVQSLGFAFVIMPLLMMATNAVKPDEGPFASGIINTPRAVAEALGVWVIGLVQDWRGGLHRDRILDTLGQRRVQLSGGVLAPGSPGGLSDLGTVPRPSSGAAVLERVVGAQTAVLTTIDTFLVLGALAMVLLAILWTLPVRTYPPRIALQQH